MVVISKMILSLILGGLLWVFIYVYNILVLKPRRLRWKLERQGITGPPPSLLLGNIPEMKKIHSQTRSSSVAMAAEAGIRDGGGGESSVPSHDWVTKAFPHIYKWTTQYGRTFIYSTGNIQFLCVTDPEFVKEVSLYTSLDLGKPTYLSKERGPLLGQGILSSNGRYWAHQRKLIAPELYPDKVKDMVTLMANATSSMMQTWESKIRESEGYAEIRVDDDMRSLSADIISRACFGSNYRQGEKIFSKLRTLQNAMSKGSIGVPGLRYVPSKNNRDIWRLEHEINSNIAEVVESHSESTGERNLLQSIIEAAKSQGEKDSKWMDISPHKFIVDNCKSIYFAGHETTATSASWCLMLLAAHPEWQARCRDEVLDVCRDELPSTIMLQEMKTLTMVIQEALRLYPPVGFVIRETLQAINFKDFVIPKGINLQIVIPILHQHPELWGPDVHEFNPERFAEGLKGACRSPQVYMPFGTGSRICVGQQFAMTELKVILSLVLSRFNLRLSPTYQHSPTFRLTMEPKHGIHLQIRRA